MSELARMFIGIILIATPFVQNASYFLGKICCALGCKCSVMNDSQKAMLGCFRAHTGGMIAIVLFSQYLIDYAALPGVLDYILRYTFALSPLFVSIGAFFKAKHKGTVKRSRLSGLICLGGLCIVFSVVVLGIGLIKHHV